MIPDARLRAMAACGASHFTGSLIDFDFDTSCEKCQSRMAFARAVVTETELEAVASTPSDQPVGSRFLLNAYGRRCYEMGIDKGKAEQRALDAPYMQHTETCALKQPSLLSAGDGPATCTCGLAALRGDDGKEEHEVSEEASRD